MFSKYGPRQANLVLIAYASSEGSGEPAHPRSLARTFAARSYKQWIRRNFQTENQVPDPSEWLGMRSWNLSWRNARRHKFAWRGSYKNNIPVNVLISRLVYILMRMFTVLCCNILSSVASKQLDRVKRICVFENSVMKNFNCACPAQRFVYCRQHLTRVGSSEFR